MNGYKSYILLDQDRTWSNRWEAGDSWFGEDWSGTNPTKGKFLALVELWDTISNCVTSPVGEVWVGSSLPGQGQDTRG